MKRTLTYFIVMISLVSCGETKSTAEDAYSDDSAVTPATPATTVTSTVAQPEVDLPDKDASRQGENGQVVPQNDSIVRFMVSFISKGFGIDHDSKDKFDQWLRERKDIPYTASPWGKEGEWSYCFPLKGKSVAEQDAFIRDVKNLLTKRDLIVFSENIVCEKRR